MKRTSEHYRNEAERCRQEAEGVADSTTKAHLFDVARQYETLAKTAPSEETI